MNPDLDRFRLKRSSAQPISLNRESRSRLFESDQALAARSDWPFRKSSKPSDNENGGWCCHQPPLRRAPPVSEPLRVITLSGLTLAGAVLDRSGVAALLRTEILCCSAALLGMMIADVTLRPVHHRHLFRRLSSSFRFGCPWVPCSSVSRRARLPSTFRTSHARPSRTSGKWGLCPVDNEDIVDYCAAEPIPARNCALGPCPQSIESFGSL